jgi:hypothetical protein
MIIPSQAMLISETVYVDGVPAAPTSITAVLYRIVNGVRSPSGVTVTATATANTGEYTFAWTNGAWNRTDEIELRVIPVIDSVSYPATIWRSHGGVDTVMRGTDNGALATTAATIANGITTLLSRITALIVTRAEATADKEDVLSALGNVPSVEEISNRIERENGSLDAVPKYGDTVQRDKVTATADQLNETITKVTS